MSLLNGEFESGDQPHENTFSEDGTKIYHASIGKVFISSPKVADTPESAQLLNKS